MKRFDFSHLRRAASPARAAVQPPAANLTRAGGALVAAMREMATVDRARNAAAQGFNRGSR